MIITFFRYRGDPPNNKIPNKDIAMCIFNNLYIFNAVMKILRICSMGLSRDY